MQFRELTKEEEEQFREWAREHWAPNIEPSPLWHPIVRDEWAKIKSI
jgi:hypothetical protein